MKLLSNPMFPFHYHMTRRMYEGLDACKCAGIRKCGFTIAKVLKKDCVCLGRRLLDHNSESSMCSCVFTYRFANAVRIRSRARWMFSTEFAYEKRRYPSPCPPNAVPDRHATPASFNK